MINLEWLRTFRSIYECNTITEASKILHMTQPGVSKHLTALEHHIGKTLFERTTRKLTPTEYGKFLYSQITAPLRALEKVERYSSNRAKKQRHAIAIGCTIDFFKKELQHKIYGFDMYIAITFGTDEELITALDTDKIQLIVGIKKYDNAMHQFFSLKEEELLLIASKNLTFPKHKKDLQHWLQKQTWFAFDNKLHHEKQFLKHNFKSTTPIVPRYILPSYFAIIDALKDNSGVALVPRQMCKEALDNDSIAVIPLSSINQELCLSYKLKNEGLEEIETFKEQLLQ